MTDEIMNEEEILQTEESAEEIAPVVNEDISSEVESLFAGDDLSEDYKTKAKAIFEAAVNAKIEERTSALEEEFENKLEEELVSFSEGLVSKMDEYLEYVVSEWMEENKLAVERGIKAEMVEDFMVGLKNLFTEHYVEIPEEKVDVVEAFAAEVETLKEELDKVVTENAELTGTITEMKKNSLTEELSENLSEVQAAKMKSLAENVEFVSEDDYREKLELIKQKYFAESFEDTSSQDALVEETELEQTEEKYIDPVMNHYVQSLSRIVKN